MTTDHWTRDERGERALKWHQEGMTNAQIAARIPGVTVNSVNGFIWRSRKKEPDIVRPAARRSKVKTRQKEQAAPSRAAGNPAVRALFTEPADSIRDNTVAEDLSNPSPDRKTVQTLTANCCRWPVGDPKHTDFHFCGREKVPGLPYCTSHAKRAFVPTLAAQRNSHQPKLEPAE